MNSRNFFASVIVLAIAYSCGASYAWAETPKLDAVYFVDMQKVIDQSIAGKAARNSLEVEVKKKEGEMVASRAEINRLKDDLQKQASLLSKSALADRQEDLQKKEQDFSLRSKDEREALSARNGRAISKLVGEIDLVVKELAAQKNYSLILERDPRFVVHVNDKFDVTDQVIDILNRKKTAI